MCSESSIKIRITRNYSASSYLIIKLFDNYQKNKKTIDSVQNKNLNYIFASEFVSV